MKCKHFLILYLCFLPFATSNAARIVPVGTSAQKINEDANYRMNKLESLLNEQREQNIVLQKRLEDLSAKLLNLESQLNEFVSTNYAALQSNKTTSLENEQQKDEFIYGYDLLTNGNPELARSSFGLFVKKNPTDPRSGEAFFWLGEIAFNAKDYNNASKYYMSSYRDFPENSKKNEALFKLSLALKILGNNEEACFGFEVLSNDLQIDAKIRKKAKDELLKIDCSGKQNG